MNSQSSFLIYLNSLGLSTYSVTLTYISTMLTLLTPHGTITHLLDSFSFVQHIYVPTLNRGQTMDVIVTLTDVSIQILLSQPKPDIIAEPQMNSISKHSEI